MWFRLMQIVQVDESGSVIGGDGRGDGVPSRGKGNAFRFLLSTLQSMGVLYISMAVSDDCLFIGGQGRKKT